MTKVPCRPAQCGQEPERQVHPGCGQLQLTSADSGSQNWSALSSGHSGGTRLQGSGRRSGLGFTNLCLIFCTCLFFGTVIPLVDFNNQ